jgi:ribosomal protein L18E
MVRSTSNLNLNLNNDANTAQAKRLPFWRKVEKVVHERSVQYTTVDDAGKIQVMHTLLHCDDVTVVTR